MISCFDDFIYANCFFNSCSEKRSEVILSLFEIKFFKHKVGLTIQNFYEKSITESRNCQIFAKQNLNRKQYCVFVWKPIVVSKFWMFKHFVSIKVFDSVILIIQWTGFRQGIEGQHFEVILHQLLSSQNVYIMTLWKMCTHWREKWKFCYHFLVIWGFNY